MTRKEWPHQNRVLLEQLVDMVNIGGIRLAVFDLDDTLYPEREFVEGGFRNVATRLVGADDPRVDSLVQRMKTSPRGAVFQTVLADLGQTATQECITELVQLYRTSDRTLTLHPDATRAVQRFRKAELHLAILTDGPLAAQQTKVRLLDLERQMDRVVYTDSYGPGFGKPCPHCFELLMKEFSVTPSQCVYIADNEAKDFFAPNALGWHSVRVIRPGGVYGGCAGPDDRYRARHSVGSLDELMLSSS